MYKEIAAEERKVRKEKPATMNLYNPATSLDYAEGVAWMNLQRPMNAMNLPAMFLGKRVGGAY